MTEEDEDDFQNNNIWRFCEKNIESDKFRDHCNLTGEHKGPAHSKCNINVTQKQSSFLPFVFHNSGNYDCHLFCKKLVDKKNDESFLFEIGDKKYMYVEKKSILLKQMI